MRIKVYNSASGQWATVQTENLKADLKVSSCNSKTSWRETVTSETIRNWIESAFTVARFNKDDGQMCSAILEGLEKSEREMLLEILVADKTDRILEAVSVEGRIG